MLGAAASGSGSGGGQCSGRPPALGAAANTSSSASGPPGLENWPSLFLAARLSVDQGLPHLGICNPRTDLPDGARAHVARGVGRVGPCRPTRPWRAGLALGRGPLAGLHGVLRGLLHRGLSPSEFVAWHGSQPGVWGGQQKESAAGRLHTVRFARVDLRQVQAPGFCRPWVDAPACRLPSGSPQRLHG